MSAIREAPEDDALRLICADWFEEQDGEANAARAEFIRVQVERARLPADDVRHSELQARELRLLRRYASIWCGAHFVLRKPRFRRGFIEAVHLHLQHFLHHRRQMLALEPIREVRLTGWHRAQADLLRRVAACEEWQHIEKLRIHHQGPHKDPHSDLLILLESPHLRRLRALHCPMVSFTADARRRFERLDILRQVEELELPYLDTYPHDPGPWLPDGSEAFAAQWVKLRSFTFPPYLQLDLLRRISSLPWWNQLTKLALVVPFQGGEAFSLLRDRLPAGLQELRLGAGSVPADLAGMDSFLEALGKAPLRSLHLHWTPLGAATLARLLDGTNSWQLQELSLTSCSIGEAHARVLASAPGVAKLRALDLAGNNDFNAAAAQTLFASRSLAALVHLNLNFTYPGPTGARALAAAPGWRCLRSLDISETGLTATKLEALLSAPSLRGLSWLKMSGGGYQDGAILPALAVSGDLARALTQLPNLVHLELGANVDGESLRILAASDSLAWQRLSWSEYDVQAARRLASPEQMPPLDAALEGESRGR